MTYITTDETAPPTPEKLKAAREKDLYFVWCAPMNGIPEQSGHGVQIIPGFGQWILLHKNAGVKIPDDAIPASLICDLAILALRTIDCVKS